MVATGPVEIVWNQSRDACPGLNWAGHIGEQPDSMPLAWHNPLTNVTSLISANDWGTFATVGPTLHDVRNLRHDCSHRVYSEVNSTLPWTYANHQWLQSAQVYPNGSGFALIHNEFHGGMTRNASFCSGGPGTSGCQYWSAGVGVTRDGGEHWTLVDKPPMHRTFSVPRRYVKDSSTTGFGAIGAMAKQGDYYYGHIQQISAGESASTALTGTCAWRTHDLSNPSAYRGYNGSGWHTTWIDPYTDSSHGDHTCLSIDMGSANNSHASMRTFAGDWQPHDWPSHLMLGWPEHSHSEVSYAFPAWEAGSAAPFTQWGAAQYLSIEEWTPPELRGCGEFMYPSLIDADSPFTLAEFNVNKGKTGGESAGTSAAIGLSYGLVGNESAALYFVVSRRYIARLPVAFIAAGAPTPRPGPYPPPAKPTFNPTNCSSFLVAGAGQADVNGMYSMVRDSATTAIPTYQKDAQHQLYHFGQEWKLGWEGVRFYYHSARSASMAVPMVWPACGFTGPTVTCA